MTFERVQNVIRYRNIEIRRESSLARPTARYTLLVFRPQRYQFLQRPFSVGISVPEGESLFPGEVSENGRNFILS